MLADSQIEHFKPKSKYPDLENNYQNLILSCSTCNNKKRDDWPSGNVNLTISKDGSRGYVDPATPEYDQHLVRTEEGSIIGITEVGKYMVKRFNFDTRPIKECFRIKELTTLINFLRQKNNNDLRLNELLLELVDIQKMLFLSKER